MLALGLLAPLRAADVAVADERDALSELWSGMYDVSEELITGEASESPLASLAEQERVQINVRRIPLTWLGTHVLYVEEYLYDEPFERRRRVLLSIDPAEADGTLRVRQFTRKAETGNPTALTADDVESVPGCDILLKRDGGQFRGGTLGRMCLQHGAREARWLDYRVVIGDGLFWYRKRTLTLAKDELVEEIAGFPHVDLEQARLFSCGISWRPRKRKGHQQGRTPRAGQRGPARSWRAGAFSHAGWARAATRAARARLAAVGGSRVAGADPHRRARCERQHRLELDFARCGARGHRHRMAGDRLRAGGIRDRRKSFLAASQLKSR